MVIVVGRVDPHHPTPRPAAIIHIQCLPREIPSRLPFRARWESEDMDTHAYFLFAAYPMVANGGVSSAGDTGHEVCVPPVHQRPRGTASAGSRQHFTPRYPHIFGYFLDPLGRTCLVSPLVCPFLAYLFLIRRAQRGPCFGRKSGDLAIRCSESFSSAPSCHPC